MHLLGQEIVMRANYIQMKKEILERMKFTTARSFFAIMVQEKVATDDNLQ